MAATFHPLSGPILGRVHRLAFVLTLTLLVWLGALAPARAALQFDVFLGYDSYVPEAGWFPIVCEVYNDGPAFKGFIEVTSGGISQTGFSRVAPVELPTGTRKLITLPVFNGSAYAGEWHVRLKDEGGRIREDRPGQRPRAIIRRHSTLLGSLSRTAGWAPQIQKPVNKSPEIQPGVARFQAPTFPDNAIVLEGLDAIYLNSERAADLRVQQASALQTWINTGGHLIVGVEQIGDVNSLPWLRQLLPIELTAVTTLAPGASLENWLRSPVKSSATKQLHDTTPTAASKELENPKVTRETPFADLENDAKFGAAPLAVATGTLRAGTAMVSAGSTPLIVTAPLGNGKITVLLFTPEREPVKSWKHQPALWARLAEVPPQYYLAGENYHSGGWGMDGIFGAMIDSRQVRKLPIFWLLVMLLAYLAIIGPVDQYWLKKINRPMLTWITFPCYVALFSGLIYLVGYKLRAGETEWNELHVVDIHRTGEQTELRGRTFGSIYSPVNARYEFAATARAVAFRSEFSGSWSADSGASDRGQIVQSESAFTADVFVPVWTSQLFVSDWLQSAEPPFFATVERRGNAWAVAVQNRLDKPLTSVRLVVSERVFELGEVPARQKKEFLHHGTTNSSTLHEFVTRHAERFQNAVQQRRQAFGALEGGRITDLPNASMAASFLSQHQPNQNYFTFVQPPAFDLSDSIGSGQAVLLAWTAGHAAAPPINRFTPRRQAENTLWRQTFTLKPNP